MDIVAGAASVSQLIAYSLSSAHCLQQLYNELKNFGTSYRNEETNVCLLLDVIKGLSDQGVDDSDPILPILLDISRLACEILHLLQPRRLLGINWTPLTKQDELKSSFGALDKKQKLLHLRVSGETLTALRTVSRQGSFFSLAPTHTMATPPPPKFTCNNNNIRGVQEVLCGYEVRPIDAEVNNNDVSFMSVNRAGNKNELSGEQIVKIVSEQATHSSEKAANDAAKQDQAGNQGATGGRVMLSAFCEGGRSEQSDFTRNMRNKRLNHFGN
ncbi:hypothetical protein HBI56_157610 [Parastagonospora nodorum]|uniref:Uncharacterized protein n=1 Tax=Phaeosphaeria nodorum (strain SN15 / ATCC MYA-4574 / FGSC 10173) TaxID=321614 RepID=A0A7U2HXF4_PHANO|nr:hypothetical protein HBH56_188350 [Parastagonospora nodorum]QRC92236.1 hypothetical protein JI435_023790 [Parastagonospora nodorum SN15]KAH3925093.1 hypothetical protein HBH54_184160 [Parastagonospora nodorum]KAH3954041.1 hypothetical protein HBH53_023510 [Parastagonospora nodorum]KAH3963882.1 hypothetical protein HBH51_163340 [Parastagonospora nodorum]